MNGKTYIELTSFMPKYQAWGENVLWAYSNLQMLGATISMNKDSFGRQSYMIRSKAFKAYKEGLWNVRDMYELNKEKIKCNGTCWYCRNLCSSSDLTADHVFPRAKGGVNNMENIIYVCKSCNSSKGKNDLMEWLITQNYTPEYLALEQYMKEIYYYSVDNNLLENLYEDIASMNLPFNPRSILLFQNSEWLKEMLNRYLGQKESPTKRRT